MKGIDYEKGIKQKNQNKWIDITKEWKEKQEESFQTLKEKLYTAPILAYPDFEKEFILYTDASGYALGAVLSQKEKDGNEHVVYYASKTLTDTERKYSAIELECYAVVWAVEK